MVEGGYRYLLLICAGCIVFAVAVLNVAPQIAVAQTATASTDSPIELRRTDFHESITSGDLERVIADAGWRENWGACG